MLGSRTVVSYDFRRSQVEFDRDRKVIDHVWLTVAELVAAVGAHAHVMESQNTAQGKKRDPEPMLAAHTVVGRFCANVVERYRAKHGVKLPFQNGLLLVPGEEAVVGSVLVKPEHWRPAVPRAVTMDDNYLLLKQVGGQLKFTMDEWNKLMAMVGMEVLAPMWKRARSEASRFPPEEVHHAGGEMFNKILFPNWLGYGAVWILFRPWVWMKHWADRMRAKHHEGILTKLLGESTAAFDARVAQLRQDAEAARADASEAKRSAAEAREAQAQEQARLGQLARDLASQQADLRRRELELSEVQDAHALAIRTAEQQRDHYKGEANLARSSLGLPALD